MQKNYLNLKKFISNYFILRDEEGNLNGLIANDLR
jgi:hypothetical protein